jgi:poly-gamma-glutamate capsule biosynthesis protein CapA/YwtB (metallophosphatase superfamily)
VKGNSEGGTVKGGTVIRPVLAVVTGVLVLLPVVACTATPAAPRSAVSASRTAPRQAGLAGTRGHADVVAGAVTLAFAGDVNFAGRTARLLSDPASAFGPITTVLKSVDFAAVNLETSITGRGTPQPKTYHFRARPAAFTALRDAGVDLVTMANNHVLDYGTVGLADTLAAARAARFPYVGIGTSAAAAWAPYLTTIKGVRIAVIGVSQVAELASSWVATPSRPGEANAIDLRRTLAAVRSARRLASVVIVFMHWGAEGQACPDQAQLDLAHRLAAAGASIIVGAHAHMLQGSGWLGHTFVAYGMGNFLWWERSYSTATGVLELTLHPRAALTARFIPAVVSGAGQPIPDRGAAARQAAARYASLRACAELSPRPS